MANNINQPMYQRIKEDILHKIESRLLLPGDRLPTEQQLMEQYKVSRITVSKALGELKRDRKIERFPNKGTFVSQPLSPLVNDSAPPQKDASCTDLLPEIACIIPNIPDLFSLSLINGVFSAFPEDKYVCHLFQSRNPQLETYLLRKCLNSIISGLVLFPQDQLFFSNELLLMHLQKYPLVLIDRFLPRLDTSYVISDHKMAGELCLNHLYDLNHRHFAFFTAANRDTFSIKRRLKGLFAAAEQHGVSGDSIHIITNVPYFNEDANYDDILVKLIREEHVTAFIAAESGLCTFLYNALSRLGIDVPDQVSLICFDKPLVRNCGSDFFTHINQSEALMGQEAGLLLRQRIEQHDMSIRHKVITPILEPHQSTGISCL